MDVRHSDQNAVRMTRGANLCARMTTFADLRLSDAALAAVREVGYDSPSPIQEQAIPELLAGRDVIGQAQTGTGKTAAFGLPMVDFVDPDDPETQALVLTPTRELCIQVTQALRTYGKYRGVDPVAVRSEERRVGKECRSGWWRCGCTI